MTPSEQAKDAGLKSLTQASEISTIPISTLRDWHTNYPERFSFILLACKLINDKNTL